MPLNTKTGLCRSLIALGAFAASSVLLAAPAAADHGHHGGGSWHSHHPRVGVYVGIPPIVLMAGRAAPYYGPYARGYYDDGERAYREGYDDGYDDRVREEWRRRHRRHHHHHDDCDD